MTWSRARVLVAVAAVLSGCGRAADPAEADGPCTCTPANVVRSRGQHEAAPMDGVTLLTRLRRHRDDVAQGKNPRDIKLADDQLRFAIVELCQPCGGWVKDRLTVEEMFPMAHLDEATRGECLALVLRDGRTVYGEARPHACR